MWPDPKGDFASQSFPCYGMRRVRSSAALEACLVLECKVSGGFLAPYLGTHLLRGGRKAYALGK